MVPISSCICTFGKKFQTLPPKLLGGIKGSSLNIFKPSISTFNLSRTMVLGAKTKKFLESSVSFSNSLLK